MKVRFRYTLSICMLAATMVIAGCATPYQSSGATGGYRDRKIDDQTYHVEFSGNGYTSRDKVHRYFMYRCAELTRQQGYTYFMVIPPSLSGAREPSSDLVKTAGFDRSMMKKVATYTPIFIYGGGGGRQHFADSADIRMFNDDAVLSTKISAWDAAEVVDRLAPYVQSEGKTQAEMPMAWVFEPGRPKVRAQDLLPTAPSKTPASGI